MTSDTTPKSIQAQMPSPQAEHEIDLREVAASLGRHKKLILIITSAAVLVSGLYAFTRKPVWEGQFQIVLDSQDYGNTGGIAQLGASNAFLSQLAGIGRRGSALETEVKVLESPSVLKPVYDFVKSSKAKAGNNVNNWNFLNWRESLEIELEKGTSVLKIAYQDTDRELVLPVIRKISSEYQRYSGRDRSKSINNGLSFAEEQVKQFRKRAANSSRALDTFAITYGISAKGESVSSSGINLSEILGSNASSNIIARMDSMSSMGSTNSTSTQGDALGQLAAINQELIRRQQRFTSRDPGVLALIRERDALRRYIEVTAGGSLTLPGKQPLSKEQAQELILKFKELDRIAKRDIDTLNGLESTLLSLQLEKAHQTDPWELISTPTLLDHPVAPNKKRLVTLGLLGGLVLGCGAALIVDRRSGLVFSDDELRTSLPGTLLERLRLQHPNTWPMAFELLAQGPLNQANSVALIPVGQPESKNLQAVEKAFQRALGQRSLVVSHDLVKTRSCDTQVLLVQAGHCSRTQLAQLHQSLALQGKPVAGWLLLDPSAEVA